MQAALGSVDLPSGVSEALSSLEMLNNIDANPVLPNGTVFQKTQVKHPRKFQGASSTSAVASPGSTGALSRSATAPAGDGLGGSGRKGKTASPAATLEVRPTMVAPRTRVREELDANADADLYYQLVLSTFTSCMILSAHDELFDCFWFLHSQESKKGPTIITNVKELSPLEKQLAYTR
jgi:hypothetical protein